MKTGYVRDLIKAGPRLRSPTIAQLRYLELSRQRYTLAPPKTPWDLFQRYADVVPDFEVPHHLAPYVDEMSRAMDEEVRCTFHAPPQHGKTTTTLLILLFFCITRPGAFHVYCSYNSDRAREVSDEFLAMCRRLGVDSHRTHSAVSINGGHTRGGATVAFTSVNGSLTGKSITGIAVIDDPIKGADDANSLIERDNAWNFFNQELRTRRSRGRLSIVVMCTRWHEDDLSGRLIAIGWPYIRLPALSDEGPTRDPLKRDFGEALFPTLHTRENLESERREIGERIWSAMYQGLPTPGGGMPFGLPTTYGPSERTGALQVVYGFDGAGYGTVSKKSDHNVCVRLLHNRETGLTLVDRVLRRQCLIQEFIDDMKEFVDEMPGPVVWFTGGQEATLAETFKDRIPSLITFPAVGKKLARAINSGALEAWNNGSIRVPIRQDEATKKFLSVICGFTGVEDKEDDDVDALSNAYHLIANPIVPPTYRRLSSRSAERLRDRAMRRRTV